MASVDDSGGDASEESISEQIFLEALAYAPGPSREQFLQQRCMNESEFVREEVRKLLAADDQAEAFGLSKLAKLSDSTTEHSSEYIGRQIGPYKLLQLLGEGGMGAVYMAEQTYPIQRKVAIKIINPSIHSKETLARFDAERQALALMDHPHIAKVLDAGATPEGQPYFVMELVKGMPITDYCDRHKLNTRRRLELFLNVCHAVAHAHQKGIIHRDLKPGNVLVADYDAEAVPKVIDFGVAKATAQKLTEKTMFTRFGQLVGTLEYMSPEQAKLNQLDVDTRSDVYSLGVLLYELLTGTTPFDRQRLRTAAFDELVRIICEEDPPRPSTRLSNDQTSTEVADKHGSQLPSSLSKLLRGELDWVVMRSMEKDRRRRYQSALNLAEDIQRYLQGEAVVACPPTLNYRFQKFVRKNRALAVVAAMVLALLTISSLAGWSRYRQTQQSLQTEKQLRLERDTMLMIAESNAATETPRKRTHLAIQAVEAANGQDASIVEKAHQALWASVVRLSGKPLVKHAAAIRAMSLSANGRWLLSASGEEEGPVLTDRVAATPRSLRLDHPRAKYARFSPDQHWVATASNGSVMLWKLADESSPSGQVLWTVQPGEVTNQPTSLRMSGDSRWLVVTYYNGQVLAWDLSSESPQTTTRRMSGMPVGRVQLLGGQTAIDHTGNHLAVRGSNDRLLIWDLNLAQREPVMELSGVHANMLEISDSGRWLVTAGQEVRLWDLSTSGPHSVRLRSQGTTHCLHFTADNEFLATGGEDGTCCIYDLTTDDPMQACLVASGVGAMESVALSDGAHRWLATGSKRNGHSVRLWDFERMRREPATSFSNPDDTRGSLWIAAERPSIIQVLGYHDDGIKEMQFGPAEDLLVAADWGGHILEYDLTKTNPGGGYSVDRPGQVQVLSVTPSGKYLVSGRRGPYSRLWRIDRTPVLEQGVDLQGANDGIGRVAYTGNGRWLVGSSVVRHHTDEVGYARNESVAHVWDLHAASLGEQAYLLDGHGGAVTALAVASNEQSSMLTGCTDSSIRLWKLTTDGPQLLHKLTPSSDEPSPASHPEDEQGHVFSIACNEDATVVVAGYLLGHVYMWRLDVPEPQPILLGSLGKGTLGIAITPDGRWVVAGSGYGQSMVWDLNALPPHAPRELPGHGEMTIVTRVTMSPNQRWLAIGSWFSGASVFDLSLTDPFAKAAWRSEDLGGIQDSAFSLDSQSLIYGNTVISGFDQGGMTVARQQVLPTHASTSALFPDGKRAVSGTGNKLIVWDLHADALIPTARRLLGPN